MHKNIFIIFCVFTFAIFFVSGCLDIFNEKKDKDNGSNNINQSNQQTHSYLEEQGQTPTQSVNISDENTTKKYDQVPSDIPMFPE